MSFTNVMKYGLVSQGGVVCIPDAAYVPQLPTLAANDFRSRLAGNWNIANNWEIYNGSTWATATIYPAQTTTATGNTTLLHNITFNVNALNRLKSIVLNANLSSNRDSAKLYTQNYYHLNGTLSCSANNVRELDVYVSGDFIMTGGTITETAANPSYGAFHFDGGKTQQFYYTGGNIINNIKFFIENNSIFKMDNYIIPSTCVGTFTLNAGCGLIIGNPSGITSSGAVGNIQSTGTRTFNTGADYTYNMSNGTQYTGNGLPTTVRNLSFTGCKKTIVLSNNITVTGTYTLNPSVKVNLNGYTLTLP